MASARVGQWQQVVQSSSVSILFIFAAFYLTTCSGKVGTASFYTPPYEPSACYGYTVKHGMTAAASELYLWKHGTACGKLYKVKCLKGTNKGVKVPCKNGKTVTVKIIDKCPAVGCKATIDLSAKAFAQIADPDEGIIKISYHEV